MKDDVKFVLAAGLFVTLMFSVLSLDQAALRTGSYQLAPTYGAFGEAPTSTEDPKAIAQFLFGPFALPLIVLSTALLVALVAALVLAKPDPEDLG